MPDAEYRAAPGLSFTGAKTLMRSPALYAYELEHGRPEKTDFDLGTAAHTVLLDVGRPIMVVRDELGKPYTSWVPKARTLRDAYRTDGAVPLLADQAEAVSAMVRAVRAHPEAGKVFEAGRGIPEVSLFWTDPATGTRGKGRLDWLIIENDDGRPEVDDLKTCTDVRRVPLMRHIIDLAYHWQGPHYVDGGLAAHGVTDVLWRWTFVEKTPPHLVRVVEPDAELWGIGSRFIAEARRRYARFLEAGAPVDYPTPDLFGPPRYTPTDPEDVHP